VVVTSSSSQITRSQAVEQLKQDIAEFHDTFRKKYLALRRKHTKELTKLRRLTNGKHSQINNLVFYLTINVIHYFNSLVNVVNL